jgi:hypothetical protein
MLKGPDTQKLQVVLQDEKNENVEWVGGMCASIERWHPRHMPTATPEMQQIIQLLSGTLRHTGR